MGVLDAGSWKPPRPAPQPFHGGRDRHADETDRHADEPNL
jgi:hypothetical protein